MTLLISDANILIDMEAGGLIDEMFLLPETFAVPDILFMEELEERHPYLPDMGLEVLEMSSNIIGKASELISIYQGPSINDLLALLLAMEKNCPLITGDKQLRTAAGKRKNRSLWDTMVNRSIAQRESYRLPESKRRLPVHERRKTPPTLEESSRATECLCVLIEPTLPRTKKGEWYA